VALAASVLVSGAGVLAMLRYFGDLRRGLGAFCGN
jgi:hypothetical protein